jgi:hypothetical protein
MLSPSHIFVSPTLASEEAFPIVNIEALACGVPVVATDWAGNKELLRDGENGFLINVHYDRHKHPSVDTKQLISSVVRTLKDDDLQRRLKRNALASARRYDYRRILPGLVNLLKKKTASMRVFPGRWDAIKNKSVVDFRGRFNDDFFFFINMDNRFRKTTYAALYKSFFRTSILKKKRLTRAERKKMGRRRKMLPVIRKMTQNFEHFIMLKSN